MHIDDGTGDWSGGTNVPHDPDLDNDNIDGNGFYYNTYFIGPNPEREHIFHWGLMAHRNDPSDEPDFGSSDDLGEGTSSTYNVGRAGFIVFDAACADSDVGHIPQQAKTWMHELGHNLVKPCENPIGFSL